MKMCSRTLGAMGIAALLVSAGMAAANPILSFTSISNNNAADAAAGEAQLRVELIASGGTLGFKFTNIGSVASAITDIYFDDRAGSLTTPLVITGSGTSGPTPVSFVQFASPSNLPGGGSLSPAFETTAGFLAESTAPPSKNGVGNTAGGEEWVTLTFNLSSNFADVMTAITNGGLRIGLHVQGFPGGGSESFVNSVPPPPPPPPPVIPLPGASALALGGLLAVGARRRRF